MHSTKTNPVYYRLAYILILLLAFYLRVSTLDARSLWFDESIEYYVAGAPLADLLQTTKIALRDPPLYSVFLHFWLMVGRTEFVMRFPSVIFSMTGIVGCIAFAKLTFGQKASLLAGIFVAISIPDIRYAQEAGQYVLMVALLPWNLIGLYQLLHHNKWKWGSLWGITAVAVAYSFYSAAITILMTTLITIAVLGFTKRWKVLGKLVLIAILCVVLILPLALDWVPAQIFSNSATKALQIAFAPFSEECRLFLTALQDYLIYQYAGYQSATLSEQAYLIPTVSTLSLILFSVLLIKHYKNIAVWWFVLGLAGYYITGRLGALPFGYRYSLNFAPLFWCCLAAGIAALITPKTLSFSNALAILASILIIFMVISVPGDPEEDLRSVAQTWHTQRKPEDVTYVYYGAAPAFRYHLEQLGMVYTYPPRWYQDCFWNRPGDHCVQHGVIYGRWLRGLNPEEKQLEVTNAISESPERIWLVFTHVYGDEENTLVSYFEETYDLTPYIYEGSALYLLEQR